MTFLDEIQAAVRDLPLLGTPLAEVDLAERERRMFAAFEEREAAERGPSTGRSAKDAWSWSQPGVATAFFLRFGKALLAGPARPPSAAELEADLDIAALTCVWGDLERTTAALGGSRVRAQRYFAEVTRVNRSLKDTPALSSALPYLTELGAIAPCPAGWGLTASGRVLATLAGPSARRWLLHLEVRQSLGPDDNWRIHPSALVELIRSGSLVWYPDPPTPEEEFAWSWRSGRRLEKLGVVSESFYGHYEFDLRPEARSLVDELVADPPSPMAVLADTLSRDVQDQSLAAWLGGTPAARAADNLLAARMVAHEIRNAILPARTALAHLFEDAGPSLTPHSALRTRIEAGLNKALGFADEQLRYAQLGSPPPTTFPVVEAVRNAIRATEAERNGRVTVRLLGEDTPSLLHGDRALFERALVNLLRNAAQANPTGPVHVTITLTTSAGDVRVCVDDDGPGVPAERRDEIFRPGVSFTGSTGQGLHLARTAVGELRGRLWCEASPLGGARFVMVLPLPARSS